MTGYTCADCGAHFQAEHFGSPVELPQVNYCVHCGSESLTRVR